MVLHSMYVIDQCGCEYVVHEMKETEIRFTCEEHKELVRSFSMNKLFFVYVCDDEIGEVEAVFDISGKMLGCWSNNDACWRDEYFGSFMKKLGFQTISRDATKEELKQMREAFGISQ